MRGENFFHYWFFLLVLVLLGKNSLYTANAFFLVCIVYKKKKKKKAQELSLTSHWVLNNNNRAWTEMRKRCRVVHFEKGFKERDWQQGCDQKPSLTNITLYFILFWLPTVVKKRTKMQERMWDIFIWQNCKNIFSHILLHLLL